MNSFTKCSVSLQPKQIYEIFLTNSASIRLVSITVIPAFPLQSSASLNMIISGEPRAIATLEQSSTVAKIENITFGSFHHSISVSGTEPIRLIYETETPENVRFKSKATDMMNLTFKDCTSDFLLQVDRFFESASPLVEIAYFFDKLPPVNHSNPFRNSVILTIRRLKGTLQHQLADLIKAWDLHLLLENELTIGFKYFFDLLLKTFPEVAPSAVRSCATCANSLAFLSLIIEAGFTQSVTGILESFFYVNDRYTSDVLEIIFKFICNNKISINSKLLQQLQPILSKEAQDELLAGLISEPIQANSTKSDNSDLQKRISQLEDENKSLINKQKDNANTIQQLKTEISSLNSKPAQSNDEELSKRDDTIKELQAKLDVALNRIIKLETQNQELSEQSDNSSDTQKINELEQQNNDYLRKIRELEAKLSQTKENNASLQDLQQKVTTLTDQCRTLQEENNNLKNQIKNNTLPPQYTPEMVHKLAVNLNDAKGKIKKAELVTAQRDIQIKELNAIIENLKKENEELKAAPKPQKQPEEPKKQKNEDKFAVYSPSKSQTVEDTKEEPKPKEEPKKEKKKQKQDKFAVYVPGKQQNEQKQEVENKPEPKKEETEKKTEQIKNEEKKAELAQPTGPVLYTTKTDPTKDFGKERVDYSLRKIASIEAKEERLKEAAKLNKKPKREYDLSKVEKTVIVTHNKFAAIFNEEEDNFEEEEEKKQEVQETTENKTNEKNKESIDEEPIKQQIEEPVKQQIEEKPQQETPKVIEQPKIIEEKSKQIEEKPVEQPKPSMEEKQKVVEEKPKQVVEQKPQPVVEEKPKSKVDEKSQIVEEKPQQKIVEEKPKIVEQKQEKIIEEKPKVIEQKVNEEKPKIVEQKQEKVNEEKPKIVEQPKTVEEKPKKTSKQAKKEEHDKTIEEQYKELQRQYQLKLIEEEKARALRQDNDEEESEDPIDAALREVIYGKPEEKVWHWDIKSSNKESSSDNDEQPVVEEEKIPEKEEPKKEIAIKPDPIVETKKEETPKKDETAINIDEIALKKIDESSVKRPICTPKCIITLALIILILCSIAFAGYLYYNNKISI